MSHFFFVPASSSFSLSLSRFLDLVAGPEGRTTEKTSTNELPCSLARGSELSGRYLRLCVRTHGVCASPEEEGRRKLLASARTEFRAECCKMRDVARGESSGSRMQESRRLSTWPENWKHRPYILSAFLHYGDYTRNSVNASERLPEKERKREKERERERERATLVHARCACR